MAFAGDLRLRARARAVETTTPGEILSFPAATRGLGSMRTNLSAP